MKDEIVRALLFDIRKINNSHHTCGIHGHRPLYTLLCDLGYTNLALKMLTQTTFPSPGYFVKTGMTTWPERNDLYAEKEWDRSLNHPMQAGFAAFLFEGVGGIRPIEPGFRKFHIKPAFVDKLKNANIEYISPYGKISLEWSSEKGEKSMTFNVPPLTEACFTIPKNFEIKEIINNSNKQNIDFSEGESLFKAGNYKIVLKKLNPNIHINNQKSTN